MSADFCCLYIGLLLVLFGAVLPQYYQDRLVRLLTQTSYGRLIVVLAMVALLQYHVPAGLALACLYIVITEYSYNTEGFVPLTAAEDDDKDKDNDDKDSTMSAVIRIEQQDSAIDSIIGQVINAKAASAPNISDLVNTTFCKDGLEKPGMVLPNNIDYAGCHAPCETSCSYAIIPPMDIMTAEETVTPKESSPK